MWIIVEKARDQRLNEHVPGRKGADVLDAIEKGDKPVRGSTLESFNRKAVLKAARYRNPINAPALGEGVDDEEIDEIPPIDITLTSDAE